MPYKRVYYPKVKPGGSSPWDEKKKVEVVQAFILLGQLRLAAASCNVPEATVKVWRATQWWKDTEQELRRSTKIQLSSKLTDIINKAMIALNDRVENGDFLWNPKTKEFVRKPISAEHANRIVSSQIDRMQALDKASSHEPVDEAGIEARLKKLQQDLIKGFAPNQLKHKVIEAEIIDVEDITPVPFEPAQSPSTIESPS